MDTTWLSGVITTFMSNVVMPTLWFGMLIGLPTWVYATMGHISIKSDFQFIVWFAGNWSSPIIRGKPEFRSNI